MTDAAQPLPNEIGPETKEDPGALTPVQQQRAAALDVARAALISRLGLFGGSQIGTSFSTGDLLVVADWILGNPDAATTEMKARPIDSDQNKAEGIALTTEAGWWKTIDDPAPSALDGPASKTGDDTDVLPSVPGDVLPE